MENNIVAEAIEKAGGIRRVAVTMGVSTQAVDQWRREGHMPNIARARALSHLSGVALWTLLGVGKDGLPVTDRP